MGERLLLEVHQVQRRGRCGGSAFGCQNIFQAADRIERRASQIRIERAARRLLLALQLCHLNLRPRYLNCRLRLLNAGTRAKFHLFASRLIELRGKSKILLRQSNLRLRASKRIKRLTRGVNKGL